MTTVPADGPIDLANGPTKIQVWDEKKAQVIAVLRAKYEVKGVVVGRDVVVMVCEFAVYIYRGDTLSILLHLTTARNERGLCALARNEQGEPWLLACPGQTPGAIRLQVGQDEANCCTIEAHKAALAGLAVNASGSLIASASEWGTVVQVHSRNGDLVHRLRRSTRPAIVTSMAFRADDRFLAVGSSSNTVHVFRIDAEHVQEVGQGPEEEEDTTPARGTAETVGGMVMGAVPGYFVEPRSIGTFRIPDTDMGLDVRGSSSTILGPQVGFRGSEPCLLVLHYNGLLYEVGFNEDSEACDDRVCQAATTWFAIRPGFKMSAPTAKMKTVAGGATEEDEEEDPWMVVG